MGGNSAGFLSRRPGWKGGLGVLSEKGDSIAETYRKRIWRGHKVLSCDTFVVGLLDLPDSWFTYFCPSTDDGKLAETPPFLLICVGSVGALLSVRCSCQCLWLQLAAFIGFQWCCSLCSTQQFSRFCTAVDQVFACSRIVGLRAHLLFYEFDEVSKIVAGDSHHCTS